MEYTISTLTANERRMLDYLRDMNEEQVTALLVLCMAMVPAKPSQAIDVPAERQINLDL